MENKHKESLKKLLRHFSDLPCKKSCQHYLKIGNCTGCNAKRDIEEAQKLLQEDRSMEKEQEYEVITPFTLVDLWNAFEDEHSCKRFQREWGKLLFEVTLSGRNIKTKFGCYRAIRKYNTLYYNLHYLEKKGFVRRKIDGSKINTDTITAYKIIEEDIVLKPGRRLQGNMTWRIIEDQAGQISLVSEQSSLLFNYKDKPLWMKRGITLMSFNKHYINADEKFEVINE